MRLAKVSHGHTLRQKLLLRLMRVVMRMEPPDVIKSLMYRGAFFGDHHSRYLQSVIRGPSSWTLGERELFAAYTAHLEACHF